MDLLRAWGARSSQLRADPRPHNAMRCVGRRCNSLTAAAVDSYHSLPGKPQATPPLEDPNVTEHPRIDWAINYIDEHLEERLSLNELAAKAGLSVWRFCVVFRQHAGVTPRRYIWGRRLQKVQSLLAGGESPASAALMTGFYDQSHLCRHFRNSCGMTPGQYIRRHRGANVAANCNSEREAA
jgi:AraC-like DNA-binding protein